MADKKISALTGATTPLAGTEVLPIVQSGSTVKVAVSDLTTGRAVSASSFSSTGNVSAGGGAGSVYVAPSGSAVTIPNGLSLATGYGVSYLFSKNSSGTAVDFYLGCANWQMNANQYVFKNQADSSTYVTFASDGNVTLHNGNIIPGTAAKGVNFTANTPAAGMTSQLLNWYEEGTWTPNQGAGLTLVGAFSSAGTYTRIGRQVFIRGSVSGATSVAVASAGAITTNLPYSAAADATGTAINAANDASSVLRVSSATLTAATAIAATTTITFSAVYSV